MKKISFLKTFVVTAALFTIVSCQKNDPMISPATPEQKLTEEMMSENGANPDEISLKENAGDLNIESSRGFKNDHYLYTEANGAGTNQIMVYEVKQNGKLNFSGTTASGGAGTGKGLGSQGALVLDHDHQWLYAVNAGDNSVSSFKVRNDGSLKLAHTINSGGMLPVSLSVHDNRLYVLNRGSDNIHGILIGMNGKLTHIAGSTQPLSGKAVDAPQISFTPYGDFVVVTEKATNKIGTFKVKGDGGIMPGKFTNSVGATPFGFDFSRSGYMIVSNAAGGAAGAGSATSYSIANNGVAKAVNGARPNAQAAPCWVAATKFGRFAYITNTASNNISSYFIGPGGALYLAEAEAAKSDLSPTDIVVSSNNYYVYALTSKSKTIGEFYRQPFGRLGTIGHVSMVPESATGLAIY